MLIAAVATPAAGQALQVMPRFGLRFGGGVNDIATGASLEARASSSWGLALGIPFDASLRSRLELVWSHQAAEIEDVGPESRRLGLDLDYLHLGGIVPYATANPKLDWILAGGLGATAIRPADAGSSDSVRLSVSLGGGLRYRISERVGVRFEGRGWFTFVESSLALFCDGGVCLVEFSGAGFWQAEAIVGLELGVVR